MRRFAVVPGVAHGTTSRIFVQLVLKVQKSAHSLCRMLLSADWQPWDYNEQEWEEIVGHAMRSCRSDGLKVVLPCPPRFRVRPKGAQPPGPVPLVGGEVCKWDCEHACWRAPNGSVHIVEQHTERKADAALEQQRLRAEVERIDREVVQRLEAAGVPWI